ncbi:hypothetical protein GOP47_0022731 [Adiantum capillus-veneris]|uniref:Uncharacterized protein n=1 Tax=Adiantum capillus-veneris TaxID=13818 RepID=A0A9D4U6D0_ADICA|nr:hypothetical protein GOP47_0022731 [Adiantum capillus-veneris]
MASTGDDIDDADKRNDGEQPPRTDEESMEGYQGRVDGEDLRQGERPHPEIGVDDLQAQIIGAHVSDPEQPLRGNIDIKGKRKMSDIDRNVVPVSDTQAAGTSSAAAELLQGGRQAQLRSDLSPDHGSLRNTRPRTQRRREEPARSTHEEYNLHPARAPRPQAQAQADINPLHWLLSPPHSAANYNLYPPSTFSECFGENTPGNEPQYIQFSAQGPAEPCVNFNARLQQNLTASEILAQFRDDQHLYAPRPDRYLLPARPPPILYHSPADPNPQYFAAAPPRPYFGLNQDMPEVQSRLGPAIAGLQQYRHRAPRPQPRPPLLRPRPQPQQTRAVIYPTTGSNIISRPPLSELDRRPALTRPWIADPRSVLSPFQQRPDLEQTRTTPLQQNNRDRHQSLYNQGIANMVQNETYRASAVRANYEQTVEHHVNDRLPQDQFMEARPITLATQNYIPATTTRIEVLRLIRTE